MDFSGNKTDLQNRENWVGIIGSRKANIKEKYRAYMIAKGLAEEGFVIVSGLAIGIDEYAHKGALDAEGKTIVIVSTPKGIPTYPEGTRATSDRIAQHGTILHPFKGKAIKDYRRPDHFTRRLLERDYLLAYLCPRIIAVSDNKLITGGTRYATHYGKALGRLVERSTKDNKFEINPETEFCKITWEMELDVNEFEM